MMPRNAATSDSSDDSYPIRQTAEQLVKRGQYHTRDAPACTSRTVAQCQTKQPTSQEEEGEHHGTYDGSASELGGGGGGSALR